MLARPHLSAAVSAQAERHCPHSQALLLVAAAVRGGLFHSSSIKASTVSPTAARRAARRMSLRTAAAAQASMGEVRCVSMLSVLSRGNLKVIQQVNPEQMKFAYGVTNVAA